MTAEAVGFFGCERGGYLDLWNCARTIGYVRAHSLNASRVNPACCPEIAPYMPDFAETMPYTFGPYTNPVDDDAWWWDINHPESAGFLGMQVTKLSGLTANSITVNSYATANCDNSIGYESALSNGYTLTFEGVLHGLTCCAVAFGLRALRKKLAGCCGDASCSGTRLRLLSCIPEEVPTACGSWVPPAETVSPWRTLVNVRMVEQPSIVNGVGPSCGTCGCYPMTRVMFTLKANADLFLEPYTVIAERAILGALSDCTLVPCAVRDCVEPSDFLVDPNCAAAILVAPSDSAVSCYCAPLFRQDTYLTIDLLGRTFDSELEVVVKAGSQQLQNLEVLIWTKAGALDFSSGIYTDCNPCNGFSVSYVPAQAILQRDMCGVQVFRPGVAPVDGSSVFAGPGGRFHDPCLRLPSCSYIVAIRSDGSATASDATIEIKAREVEP